MSTASRCFGNKIQIPQAPHVAATTGPLVSIRHHLNLPALPLGLIVSLGRKLQGGPPGSPGPPALSRLTEAALLTRPVPGGVWAGRLREKPLPCSSEGVPGLPQRELL